MRRRRILIAAAMLAALWALLAGAGILYHGVRESAHDKCFLNPPWYDLPAPPVRSQVKWRWFPPDSTCVFTLPDGSKVERDWTEPPWRKLPPHVAARILSEFSETPGRVTCRPSIRLDYRCAFANGRVVFVRVDRWSIEEQAPGSP